jgi:V8-like Glu-specific endopeptidase
MVSSEMLLTNEHCIPNPRTFDCDNLRVVFGYEEGSLTEEIVDCPVIVETSYPLDYALLRIDKGLGDKWGYLNLSTKAPQKDARLFVVQHPNGERKKISIQGCYAGEVPIAGREAEKNSNKEYIRKQDFQHSCDTEGGSSGSPVLDDETSSVVGLHHYGFSPTDTVRFNQAVSMTEILNSIPLDIKSKLRSE